MTVMNSMCGRCGQTGIAFKEHRCERRLGPRLAGPGFNMRWRLRSLLLMKGVIHLPAVGPVAEMSRSQGGMSVECLASACIAFDRRITGHPRRKA